MRGWVKRTCSCSSTTSRPSRSAVTRRLCTSRPGRASPRSLAVSGPAAAARSSSSASSPGIVSRRRAIAAWSESGRRSSLAERRARSALAEPAGQLDRVERVPTRDLVDAREQRVGDRLDRSAKHAAEDVEADRTEIERVATARRKRARDRQRILRIGAGSNGLEHADALAVEPAQRVAQGSGGGRVEPLHVVDRQHDGPARGELPERRPGSPVRGRTGCPPLRARTSRPRHCRTGRQAPRGRATSPPRRAA